MLVAVLEDGDVSIPVIYVVQNIREKEDS